MSITEEKRQAFLNDPTDKRHGTHRGYNLRCRCDRCLDAGRAYARACYERGKYQKPVKVKAKPNKAEPNREEDVCAASDPLERLMGKQSELRLGRCAVCGEECDPTPTAILHGMPDLVYRNGVPARNPRIDMCPECAALHAQKRLHFRWVETESTLKGRRLNGTGGEFLYIGGHWEWRTSKEPMPMQNAWRGNAKWRRIR